MYKQENKEKGSEIAPSGPDSATAENSTNSAPEWAYQQSDE